MRHLRHSHVKRGARAVLLFTSALFLVAVAFSIPVFADATESAVESFGHYLLDHDTDITPFLKKHQEDIYRLGAPGVQYVLANIFALNLVVGWISDFICAYLLSRYMAPVHAHPKQAVAFATGNLFLIVFYSLFSLFLFFTIGSVMPLFLFEILIVLLLFAVSVVQTMLVSLCYQITPDISAKFYAVVFVVHILALGVCFPITKARTSSLMSSLANQVATPTLDAYIGERKGILSVAEDTRDKVKGEIAAAQAQIDKANTDQVQLRKQIADMKASELFVFRRIVHLHAEGDLISARDQLNAFMTSFPAGKLIEPAKAQLTQVTGELAALDAQKQQAEAAAAQAAAQARADFLARAGRGEITLSEMHKALQGKTPADVKDLFGEPSAIEAGRWGYSQQMIVNPMTNQKYGLAVYFVEGFVQSVDYFYVNGQ